MHLSNLSLPNSNCLICHKPIQALLSSRMHMLKLNACWKIAAKRNQTVIWVKPLTNDCYLERAPGTQPPLCRSNDDPDAVYGVNMEACVSPYSDHDHANKGSGLAPWPAMLTSPPPRLAHFWLFE